MNMIELILRNKTIISNTLNSKKYFSNNNQELISGSAVREIHKDDNGNFLIGSDAGLNKYNPKLSLYFIKHNDTWVTIHNNIHALSLQEGKYG
jgi:ligand-binding sensor domain-containing protein